MIKYLSTRGNKKLYSFSEAILKGIANDGGLFVPQVLPRLSPSDIEKLQNKSYQERAIFMLNYFQSDFSDKEIRSIVHKAYSSNFDNPKIAPLVNLKGNQYILELWHGPTGAFKDMALQIMPLFFSEALEKNNRKRLEKGGKPLKYLILVATSGDTGKAALEGYKDKKDISIIVFYPDGHVSQLQELQMITQEGPNVDVYAVKGDFDDTQKLVKDIFNDQEFNKKLLDEFQVVLSSANSINWGRLIPQIIYYVSSYVELVQKGVISMGDEIDVAVPTGNFGNILAAYYAKKIGLPIRKLICASNANNVLSEFLKTGIYDISKRNLIQTSTPSMDILVSSNIERLLYMITNDAIKVYQWMQDLKEKRRFEVDQSVRKVLQKEFYADWVSNEECLENIKKIFEETDYLMDPHSSVAQAVAERYIEQNKVSVAVIICSTAHFSKFPKDIYKAIINDKNPSKNEFELLSQIQKIAANSYVPRGITILKQKRKIYMKKFLATKSSLENAIIDYIKCSKGGEGYVKARSMALFSKATS